MVKRALKRTTKNPVQSCAGLKESMPGRERVAPQTFAELGLMRGNGFAHGLAKRQLTMDFYPLNQKKEIIKKYLRHHDKDFSSRHQHFFAPSPATNGFDIMLDSSKDNGNRLIMSPASQRTRYSARTGQKKNGPGSVFLPGAISLCPQMASSGMIACRRTSSRARH